MTTSDSSIVELIRYCETHNKAVHVRYGKHIGYLGSDQKGAGQWG